MSEWLNNLIPKEWLDFIILNWETLFPGIGIVVLTAIGGFLRWLFKKKSSSEVDTLAIVDKLMDVHQRELGTLESKHQVELELENVKKQLKESIEALAKMRGPDIDQALEQLKKGDTKSAEAVFQTIADRSEVNIKKGTKKGADAYRHIGALAFFHNTQKALACYLRANELEPNNLNGWNQLGNLYRRVGELDQAILAYNKILQLSKSQEWKAIALGNIGNIYKTRGELEQAEAFYHKALVIYEVLGRKEGMAMIYGNLGNGYYTRGELEQAEEFYRKALAIGVAIDNKEGMATQYIGLGIIYQLRGELEQAEEFCLKALTIDEAMDNKEGMASDYTTLGLVYQLRGELDQALVLVKKSRDLYQALGAKDDVVQTQKWIDELEQSRDD